VLSDQFQQQEETHQTCFTFSASHNSLFETSWDNVPFLNCSNNATDFSNLTWQSQCQAASHWVSHRQSRHTAHSTVTILTPKLSSLRRIDFTKNKNDNMFTAVTFMSNSCTASTGDYYKLIMIHKMCDDGYVGKKQVSLEGKPSQHTTCPPSVRQIPNYHIHVTRV